MKKLNICCGTDLREGWDNADHQKNEKVIYCNINEYPYPFEYNTYDYVLLKGAYMYAEHPEKVLEELRRITKPNGTIKIEDIPYYNNKGAVSCLGMQSFFSETTFIDYVSHFQPSPESYQTIDSTGTCYFPDERHFEILSLETFPSKIGKWIYPKWLRVKLSCMIGGLISSIDVEFKVIKLNSGQELK